MDTLTQLQQNRRIIHDLTSSTLARISSPFSRLVYLASLRDISTNVYEHAGLSAVYPKEAVRQALEQCHQELFERILETPLVVQEEDLRAHLRTLPMARAGPPRNGAVSKPIVRCCPPIRRSISKSCFARICVRFWRFSRKSFQRNRRLGNRSRHPALFLTLGMSRIPLEPTANIAAKPGGDATTNLLF